MKLFAIGVFVFGLSVIGCRAQFKSSDLAADLAKAVSSGNVPMPSFGTEGVPAIIGSPGLPSSGSSSEQQTTATDGNKPVSVQVGSRMKNIVSFVSQTRKLLRKLSVLDIRMGDLEKYFNDTGVFSPVEKTAEGATFVPQFGGASNFELPRNEKRQDTVESEITQINERIEELQKAIADYKTANPVVAVTAAPEAAYTEGMEAQFSDRRYAGYFTDDDLYDISGIGVSLSHKDLIYAANDKSSSSNLNDFYVVNATTGEVLNTIEVKGAKNHDWEDMAVAPCDAGSKSNCIYIGDIGKGSNGYPANNIYKIVEPDDPLNVKTVDPDETISFTGVAKDMETLMVSPENDIYVIPEGDDEVDLFKIENGEAKYVCEVTVESRYSGPTSGDISSCGTMILLKANEYVYLFSVSNRDYEAALCNPTPTVHRLQYTQERENQAIAFKPGECRIIHVKKKNILLCGDMTG